MPPPTPPQPPAAAPQSIPTHFVPWPAPQFWLRGLFGLAAVAVVGGLAALAAAGVLAAQAWMAGLLLTLGGSVLVVVAPMARASRQQLQALAAQAQDLHRLAQVAEQTQALVIITDREDRIEWVNPAFEQRTGWRLAEAKGQLPMVLLGRPRDPAGLAAGLDHALAHGHGARVEAALQTRDGHVLWTDVDLRPLHDGSGELSGYLSVATDVTERVLQRQKTAALWATLPLGVVLYDAQGRVVEANLACENLLGLDPRQGHSPADANSGWQAVLEDGSPCPPEAQAPLLSLRSGRALHNQLLGLRSPQGDLRWLTVNTEPQFDADGRITGVLACYADVSEQRRLQAQLQLGARTDALTALPNRAALMDRLRRAIAQAQRHPAYTFAVLFMDIDRFKQVNDTHGHSAGDELLRQVAERLSAALRPSDAVVRLDASADIAARIGGDEFVVVLDGVQQIDDVLAVTQRLLDDLSQPYILGTQAVHSGTSIGIVLADHQHSQAEDILRHADTAMYEAKRAGRGRCVVFDPSMHERVVHALALQCDLRIALQEEQLFVVYQPVLDLNGAGLVCVEALVRWRHPQRGLVPAQEFVGIAEESGLIDALGAQVLTLACKQFMQWQQAMGPAAPRQLAVNLSLAQLQRSDLAAEVHGVLKACGMAAGQLQLEITETLAAQDERVQATLRELKALGVTLALDDFGAGYSSLACLHQLPVDTVKIDRSFIAHAEALEYHRVLIEATIRVARTLGMRTVAEGIETPGQAALMLHLQCDHGQGYLYGPPMTAAELQRWALQAQAAAVLVDTA